MKRMLTNKWLILAIRILLGALFIYASFHKIIKPDRFLLAVNNYRFLPEFLARPFAAIVPWVELLCGLGLITGIFLKGASLVTTFLYLAFVVALVQALARGLDISCGCFADEGAEPIQAWTLVRDSLLLLLALWVFISSIKKPVKESAQI